MLPWAPFRIVLRSSPSGGTPDVAGPYQCSYTDNGPLDTAIEGSIPSTQGSVCRGQTRGRYTFPPAYGPESSHRLAPSAWRTTGDKDRR